jgi:hypothetical protein
MNKKFFLNLLFLGSASFNLLAITGEDLVEAAQAAEKNGSKNLSIASVIQEKIKNAKLPCYCREELYNAVKGLPLSDVFKPRGDDCVMPSQDSEYVSEKEGIHLKEIEDSYESFYNNVDQYLQRINNSNVTTECRNLLFEAVPGLATGHPQTLENLI